MGETPSSSTHTWKFFRAGGFDQVSLESGADFTRLGQLDQKLWVALACPTTGIEFDAKTAALIDTNQDGRIRAPELISAVNWTCNLLKNPGDLVKGSPALPLSAINDATPEGVQLLASAKQLLINLGKADAGAVTLDDTADQAKIFAATNFNGDGIVPADAADDAATKAVIADIIACLGAETDRSGKPGVSQARVDAFFADAAAFADWSKKAETDKAILPAGEATAAAAAAVKTVKAKVDDYFARCKLAAYDSRALAAVNRQESEYLELAAKDMTITASEISSFPLAQIAAGKALPLKDGLNPAWAAAIAKLQADAIKPLLGDKTSLTEADWLALLAKLGPFECWQAGRAGASVEKLSLKRVREILGGKSKETLAALITQDKALEPAANAIAAVEKLVRFHRDLNRMCMNFVNFKEFYDGGPPAVFQTGTLYLDQRSCELCLPVDDAGRHASMAGLAGAYLAYCDCVRKNTGEKRSIVAVFSQGGDDNLMVGRNGVFYDRQGRDWDATITKIVANPISLRAAFWSPYKKLARMIEEQIAKRAAAADASANTKMAAAAQSATNVDKTKPAEPKKVDVGAVAAMGVALSALSAAAAGMLGVFKGIEPWQVPLILIGILLVISLPSMVLAFLQLRKRNLGPILDANGWAINAKAKINVPFGTRLTGIAKLPRGASVSTGDKYAEGSSILPKLLLFAFIVWWIWAFLNDSQGRLWRWTDGKYGKIPAAVQKALDEQAAAEKPANTKPESNPATTKESAAPASP